MTKSPKHLIIITLLIFTILVTIINFARADKGQDIIIYNGKIILKGGKKKGNIIITGGGEKHHSAPKYPKKYMNYGGFWK